MKYLQITIPQQIHLHTATSYEVDINIAYNFLNHIYQKKQFKSKINITKVNHVLKPFTNFTHDGTYLLGKFPAKHIYQKISGIELDYILVRVFLTTQMKFNHNFFKSKLVLISLPPMLFWCYWLIFIVNIVLNILVTNFPLVIDDHKWLIQITKINLFLIFLIVLWFLYIITIFVQPYFKNQIENSYEAIALDFVKEHYNDFKSDYILARQFSRKISYSFNLGFNLIFKVKYRYTGPLGVI